jgi:hypothetical protein
MKRILLSIVIAAAASGVATAETAGFAAWLETVNRADKNSDGMLTADEIAYFDPRPHEAGFRPFMIDHFMDWDRDGDGMLSMDEIKQGRDRAGMTDLQMSKAFFESVGFQPPRNPNVQ